MKKGLSEIVAIVDRSGSMGSIKHDAIGGFNEFIKQQQDIEGSANFSLVLFDNEYQMIHNSIDINNIEPLTDKTYQPRGSTALLDAIGRTVNTVGDRLRETIKEDRPENVIIAILTDGEENSSREFSNQQIEDMIRHQEDKYNWEFLFLAANQDAIATATSFGMKACNAMSFMATSDGMQKGYADLSRTVTSYRTGSKPTMQSDDPTDI